jgi:hypothetical protein
LSIQLGYFIKILSLRPVGNEHVEGIVLWAKLVLWKWASSVAGMALDSEAHGSHATYRSIGHIFLVYNFDKH